jgi:hypothetical protein
LEKLTSEEFVKYQESQEKKAIIKKGGNEIKE